MSETSPDPPEDEEVAVSEAQRKRRGTFTQEVEGRVARSTGGADFIARVRRIGYGGSEGDDG